MNETFESIQIFAADHRQNVNWFLPYIRLGNCQSDAMLKITTVQVIYHKVMSEVAQIIDIKNKINEFGNPTYVGICHYRRFFAVLPPKNKRRILNISLDKFQNKFCCTPLQQFVCINKMKLDALVVPSIRSFYDEDADEVNNLFDEFVYFNKNSQLNFDLQLLTQVFDIFKSNFPMHLSQYLDEALCLQSFHPCNIFTCRKEMFCEIAEFLEKTFYQAKSAVRSSQNNIDPRWFGYFAERFTSTYFECIKLSGKKILSIPLLTIL